MVSPRNLRVKIAILSIALLSVALLFGCGGRGHTDGSEGSLPSDAGDHIVSDGAAGGTLTIAIRGNATTLRVGDTTGFSVTAIAPNGAPQEYIRIFCESERGIAILEPSAGGVAFEHTNSQGMMSGVIGGLTPGSYIMECRGPQGFNLKARIQLNITGEIPQGFDGWPGAAGGNLGGGLITEPPTEDVTVIEVLFSTITNTAGSREGYIDLMGDDDCDDDPETKNDSEDWGPDSFVMSVRNGLQERILVDNISFKVKDGRVSGGIAVPVQGADLIIEPGATESFSGNFTATYGVKYWPGTNTEVIWGVYDVDFVVSGHSLSGEPFTATVTGTIIAENFDNC